MSNRRLPVSVDRATEVHPIRNRWVLWAFVVSISAPIFVDVSRRTLTARYAWSPLDSVGLTIHIAAFTVPIMAILVVGRYAVIGRRLPSRPGQSYVFAMIVLLTVSLLVGQLAGSGSLSIAFYLQTVVPLVAFLVGAHCGIVPHVAVRILLTTVAISVVGLLIIGFTNSGVSRVVQLAVIVPQVRNYFPLVIVIAAIFAVAYLDVYPKLSLASLAVFAAFLPLLWSRTALGMAAIALPLTAIGVATAPHTLNMKRFRAILVAGAIVAVAVAVLYVTQSGVVGERDVLRAQATTSSPGREDFAREALGFIMANPATGRMFIPEWDSKYYGREVDVPRLFGAHNQYLDYALRGGVLTVVMFVALLGTVGLRSWRTRNTSIAAIARWSTALAVIVAVTAMGNFFQVYYVQTYTGSLLYFLLGVGAAVVGPRVRGSLG